MGLLAKLFARHYRNAESALALFQKRVAEVDLGFDVQTQCRETEYPAQASFPIGMPSSIAYYLPRTSFGTVKKKPADVNDDANYRNADGIGLNRGCPIRLARALDVLGHLDPKDREEPIRNLRDP